MLALRRLTGLYAAFGKLDAANHLAVRWISIAARFPVAAAGA
jgi:hypothetical protein